MSWALRCRLVSSSFFKSLNFTRSFRFKSVILSSGLVAGAAGFSSPADSKPPLLPFTEEKPSAEYYAEPPTSKTIKWKVLFLVALPDLHLIIVAVVAAIASALLNIYIPQKLGDLTQALATLGTSLEPIKRPAYQLLHSYVVQSALTLVYGISIGAASERFAARLRSKVFANLLHKPLNFFDSHQSGALTAHLTQDVQNVRSAYKAIVSQGMRSITQTIGCVCAMVSISPVLTAALFVPLPIIGFLGNVLGTSARETSRLSSVEAAHSAAIAEEALSEAREVKALALESQLLETYSNAAFKASTLATGVSLVISAIQAGSNFALNAIVLGTLTGGGKLLLDHKIAPGDLMAFLVSAQTIQRSIINLVSLSSHLIKGASSALRISTFLDDESVIHFNSRSKCVPNYDIEFKNVNFTYPSRPSHRVLHDLSLSIQRGSTVALVGASGGGKTTIGQLLLGLYQPTQGCVCIGNVDVSTLDMDWLRGDVIGYIGQSPTMFAASVKDNIKCKCENISDEGIKAAAVLANADGFIEKLPQGYDTQLGQRGVNLSGGQRQRLAIARALVKKPHIILLDEATSSLDAESEQAVQEGLERVCKGKTVLVIAHRLSSIQHADLIVVIDEGRIVESGTHEALLKKREYYYRLVNAQISK